MKSAEIRAKIEALVAIIAGIQAGAEGYTAEQVQQIEAHNAEYEQLEGQLKAALAVEKMQAAATTPAPRAAAPAQPGTRVEVVRSATDKFGGFKSSGEFLMAVKNAAGGSIAPQLQNVMYEKNGEDGGFLVPEEISTVIQKKLDDPIESLLAQTTQTTVSGNAIRFPVDESQPWNSGVIAYWIAEGEPYKASQPKIAMANLRLEKLGALVKATDELLEDTVALESWIKSRAPEAIMHKANSAILSGDGAGKPEGLLRSGFTVTVLKEAGQAADTIVPMNIIKMYSHMIPSAIPGAKWYINAGAVEQLNGMKDAQGNLIYLQGGTQMNQGPYGLLLGRPVVPMMAGLPGLGDAGDIVFANLKYYWTIVKAGGVKQATSIHLHFDRDITSFKFSLRLDGKVPFKTPVTPENSTYQMSAFVKLEDR